MTSVQAGGNISSFPGSQIQLVDAVRKATIIDAAVLVKLGYEVLSAPGQVAYEGSIFKIRKIFKGGNNGAGSVRIIVESHGDIHETEPTEGNEYILFISPDDDKRLKAFKIIPDTESNLSKVTAAIASARQ